MSGRGPHTGAMEPAIDYEFFERRSAASGGRYSALGTRGVKVCGAEAAAISRTVLLPARGNTTRHPALAQRLSRSGLALQAVP